MFSLAIIASVFITSWSTVAKAWAAYSTSFTSPFITVTSPSEDNTECSGSLLIQGTSSLDRVWICLRGPAGELETCAIPVREGHFSRTVSLRFGPGIYTVWAGDNCRRFDGSVRFEVHNTVLQDNRYILPSAYVDSDSSIVKALAESLVASRTTDMEKLRSIHAWVTKNVAYDYNPCSKAEDILVPASQTVTSRKGICLNYALITAALARAAGLPARVVYGEAGAKNTQTPPQLHAWNEILVNGRWISVDTTWDAGYVKNGTFVPAPSTKYLNPDQSLWGTTHRATEVTLY